MVPSYLPESDGPAPCRRADRSALSSARAVLDSNRATLLFLNSGKQLNGGERGIRTLAWCYP